MTHTPLSGLETETDVETSKTSDIGSLSFMSNAQKDVLQIIREEQDRAMSLLAARLSSLFLTYADRAAALDGPPTLSPIDQEWSEMKALNTRLQEEVASLRAQLEKETDRAKTAEDCVEAFRAQIASLKDTNRVLEEQMSDEHTNLRIMSLEHTKHEKEATSTIAELRGTAEQEAVSPETETDAPVPAPDSPKDEVKAEEPTTAETHTTEPSATDATPPTEPAKDESKPDDEPAEGSTKEDRPKSPSFLSKLLGGLKQDKYKAEMKVKAKTSKGGKKGEPPALNAEEPADPSEPSPSDAKPEDKPAPKSTDPVPVLAGLVEETEAPAPTEPEAPVSETTPEEVKKDEKKEEKESRPARSPAKISRRLNARVSDLFKPMPEQVNTPAKVDEAPPKIDEPTPVVPIQNPTAESTPASSVVVTVVTNNFPRPSHHLS